MRDDLTWGIDLSGSPWSSVCLHSAIDGTAQQDEPRVISGPDLLDAAEPYLLPSLEGDPAAPVLDDWSDLRDGLRQVRDAVREMLPESTPIGVAYPRSMPPILRQFLPIVLGQDPASSRGGLPGDSPLVGLDAPLALILEALAQEAIPASGDYLVAAGREWTIVAIEKAAPTNPALRGPLLWLRIGPTAATPDAIERQAGTVTLIAGDDCPAPTSSVVRLAPTAIGAGAARFARWRVLEFTRRPSSLDRRLQSAVLPGTPICVHKTIYPLGLIGDNGRGEWFWRRLFEPGTAIPTERAWLRSITRPPCYFFLAECRAPGFRHRRWLTREQWAPAQLRWHSTSFHSHKNAPAPPLLRWSLEMREFNDDRRDASTPREEVPPRWGLPHWIARAEEDIAEPL